MSINRSRLMSLITGINATDSKLFEVLRELILEADTQGNLLETQQKLTALEGQVLPPDVIGLSVTFTRQNVILNWNPVASFYEVRQGSDWDTANRILTTATTQVVFAPHLIGTTRYLVKSLSIEGAYSANAAFVDVIVPAIGTPTPSAQVIDNNVLLRWAEPSTTFDILHYIVDKDGTPIGTIRGTFTAIFEVAGGDYTYGITAVDIAGNQSPRGTVDATITQPPDYELSGTEDDDFSGTKNNCIEDEGRLIAPVFDAETWAQHFTNNTWDQIQDAIDDGYPYWLEPSESSADYEQIFDFGALFTDTLVSVILNSILLDGSVTVVVKIAVSDDNVTYSSFATASSLFVASVRYVKIRLEFTPADDQSLIVITSLTVNLNIKREIDSGDVNADSTDTLGTFVAFNKAFKDVDSITLTVESVDPITAVYDFDDVPDPPGFYVFAFDAVGARVDYLVSWKARGVV